MNTTYETGKILWFSCWDGNGMVQMESGVVMPFIYDLIDGVQETLAGNPSAADQVRLMDIQDRKVSVITSGSTNRYTARVVRIYILPKAA